MILKTQTDIFRLSSASLHAAVPTFNIMYFPNWTAEIIHGLVVIGAHCINKVI